MWQGKGNRRGTQTETESIERKELGELVGIENCIWYIYSFCIELDETKFRQEAIFVVIFVSFPANLH